MKLSKSILNPIRATRNGGAVVSLSFLCLRLRRTNNDSGKKRGRGGDAFENPEPTSPKVTCIGQVRVKSKKKAKQCRSLSKRRTGEVSFRRREQNPEERLRRKNQRWVHLPISVCEALRAEFSCLLFPCKFTCCISNGERDNNNNNNNENGAGCGAVLARSLVLRGEGGRQREIEVVVGAAEEERMCGRSSRRHVFNDIEVKSGRIEVKGRSHDVELEVEEEEERGRVSICIPPKNALLLMKYRSDPMKMANREYLIEEESVDFEGKAVNINCGSVGKETEDDEEEIQNEAEPNMENYEENFVNSGEERTTENDVAFLLPQKEDQKEEYSTDDEEEQKANLQKNQELENSNNHSEEEEEEERRPVLPECLLLMMCEPKLSMEVSKETWVRSTDFIRWLPAKSASCDHHQLKRRPTIEYSKAKPTVPTPPAKKNDSHQLQPPRSSCSLPAASMIEQNLGAYEPAFALTRCKSEPMRTAAAKLVPPDSCLWKNGCMKVEPHGQAALGVGGAAWVGC